MTGMDIAQARFCHCLAARKQARALTRFFEARLRPHGLRATQFSILAALHLKEATPLGELAELLGLERTSLTRSVGLLEERGWVAEAPSDDARERRLQITKKGSSKIMAAFPAWKQAQDEVDRRGPQIVGQWIDEQED